MNSLYQQLQPQNQLKQTYNMLKNSNNPMQLIQNIAKQNPRMQQIMNMVNMSGRSPKELFYQMAQQRGVDPNQILNMFR